MRTVLRGNLVAVNTYIKSEERSQINNLILYLKDLRTNETYACTRKEMIKTREGMNERANRKTIDKSNNTKSCLNGKKCNKANNLSKKRERILNTSITDEIQVGTLLQAL